MKLATFLRTGVVALVVTAAEITSSHADQPQTLISFSGIAIDTGMGYTAGDLATFTFGLNRSFNETGESVFTESFQSWLVTSPGVPSVFSSISGTGLTGTYVPGSGPITVSSLGNGDSGFIGADAQNGDGLGLFAGGTELGRIYLELGVDPNEIHFAFPGSYTPPSTYFSDYAGTYATDPDSIFAVFRLVSADTLSTVDFTPMSVTIVTVPEPRQAAIAVSIVLAGIAVLYRAGRRRGTMQQSPQ